MNALLQIALLTVTIIGLTKLLPGVRVKSTGSAVLVAVVFSLLNWVIGWLVMLVVGVLAILPAILTLGLAFLAVPFLVNTFLLWITDKVMDSFEVTDGKTLLIGASIITLVNFAFGWITRN
jgi:putative membrane protein